MGIIFFCGFQNWISLLKTWAGRMALTVEITQITEQNEVYSF